MRLQSRGIARAALVAVLLGASVIGCTVAINPGPVPSPSASAPATATAAGPTSTNPAGSVSPGASAAIPVALPSDPPVGAEAPVDDHAWALVARLRASAYTPDTTDAAIEALARAGIGTFEGTAATQPIVPVAGVESPMRVLDWQAHALAVQAWGATMFTGQELDDALALDPELENGVPLASQLLAGYVATADTPGGAMSRALMAGQNLLDPSSLRIPSMVLSFFLSDLATDGGTIPAARGIPTGRTAALGTICSDAANWVNNTIHRLFEAIKLATPANLPGRILVGIWNWLVDRGEAFVHRLIGAVTDAILAQVRYIAAGVARLVQGVAAFLPYAVAVHIEPMLRFVLPPSGPSPSGVFVASVSAGDLPDWPDVLKDCAGVAQVALPNFRPAGAPVTWGPLHGDGMQFVIPMIAPSALDGNGQARWSFGTRPDGVPPGGEEVEAVMFQDVQVHRPEIEDARSSIADRLHGGLPDLIAGFVGQLFAPFLNAAAQRLDALLVARGQGAAFIVYHEPVEPTATPSASRQPSPQASMKLLPLPDPCSLITQQEAADAAGVAVEPGTSAPTELAGSGVSGLICPFGTPNLVAPGIPGAAVAIGVYDLGLTAPQRFADYKQVWMQSPEVTTGEDAGLGDDNFYTVVPEGSTVRFIRRQNIAVVVTVITTDGLAQSKRLAELALSRF